MKIFSKLALFILGAALFYTIAVTLFAPEGQAAYTSEARTFRELSASRYSIAWGTSTLTAGTVAEIDTGLGYVVAVTCSLYVDSTDKISCVRSATSSTPEIVNLYASGTTAAAYATWIAIGVGK